jgi:hypothetical protein
MNDITLITPPDFLLNDSYGILLICPSNTVKDQLNHILINSDVSINLMIYENNTFDNDIDWLLKSVKIADCVIIDVDNCDALVRHFASHIISQPHTFYLTNDVLMPYNLISNSRVFDFTWLENFINRGKNEKAE